MPQAPLHLSTLFYEDELHTCDQEVDVPHVARHLALARNTHLASMSCQCCSCLQPPIATALLCRRRARRIPRSRRPPRSPKSPPAHSKVQASRGASGGGPLRGPSVAGRVRRRRRPAARRGQLSAARAGAQLRVPRHPFPPRSATRSPETPAPSSRTTLAAPETSSEAGPRPSERP